MPGAHAADLLDLWESAAGCEAPERALRLLAFALPDKSREALADFDLGLRDWHLLWLRRALFGSAMSAYADCPYCGERLEIELDTRDLQDEAPLPPAPNYVSADGKRFRLPRCADLIAVANIADAEAAARELFTRCGVDATVAGADFEEVDNGLSALAAERALRLDLTCAVCGERWQFDFDAGAFVWEEIEACALALLDDVHQLASAYGWSERAILALSDVRRAAYLRATDSSIAYASEAS